MKNLNIILSNYLDQGCPTIFTSGRNCFIPFSGRPQYRGVHSGWVWIEAFWTQRGPHKARPRAACWTALIYINLRSMNQSYFITQSELGSLVSLSQWFSTGVPRHPGVPFASSRGAAGLTTLTYCFILFSIDTIVNVEFEDCPKILWNNLLHNIHNNFLVY